MREGNYICAKVTKGILRFIVLLPTYSIMLSPYSCQLELFQSGPGSNELEYHRFLLT